MRASKKISLVIFGSRTAFPSIEDIENGLSQFVRMHDDLRDAVLDECLEVVTGKQRGADSCGEAWARGYGYPVVEMPADWNAYGRAAGPIRNSAMAARATHGLGFRVDGKSDGTDDMEFKLRAAGKPVLVVEWRPER